MNYIVLALASAAVYMVLAFAGAKLAGLSGANLWVVFAFLALIGAAGACIYIWWRKRREVQTAGSADAAGTGADELSILARDAEARIAASNLTRGAKLGNLPAIFLIGPPGSAKTSTMVASGLEPELLAGQVYQDNRVAPTRGANLWFARQTVFVDASGKLLGEPARWVRFVKRLAPKRLAAAFGKNEQAPRAAVVCFDLEEFLKPGAADAVPVAARNLHARLGEISQTLGIDFPVYALFTRADRVPFFLDYVRNLGNEEAGQVLGATLPLEAGAPQGVYAERATQRLSAAFDELFYSLAAKRVPLLAREHAAEKLPGAYEFPREFRKLRAPLVQFLVDISKPSQLRAAPFLRGFYFSGVRPMLVNEVAAPPVQQAQERTGFEAGAGATGYFRAAGAQRPAAPQPQVTGTRHVPQWTFLVHFWNDIILGDHAAIAASSSSVKTNALRRILFAIAAGLCLLYSIALLVSYERNRGMESRVLDAARALTSVSPGQDLPSLDSLQKLETLRQEFATLSAYERDGAPLSMRWGLYCGSELYPEAYRLYFDRFHALLFAWTQSGMLDTLHRLPPSPGPADTYAPPYNTLKAYLITTSEWKRSTRPFLSPYLLNRWAEGRGVDPDRIQLAQKQFDFYSDELALGNPFSALNEADTIERARRYLRQFNADERLYQGLIEEASKRNPSINFNRLFPNQAVSDGREVRGAFTKDGWNFVQSALRKSSFGGEDWVLGPQTFANVDSAQLEQRLRGFYTRDFIQEWREFLRFAAVSHYGSLSDAASKLAVTSSGQSPLLGLLCLVSQNTGIDLPGVKTAFQAPQQVVPSGCQTQYVGSSNQSYMASLLKLQNSVQQIAQSGAGPNDPAAAQTISQANDALLATGQIAQTFAIDKDGNVPAAVKKLMEDPITDVLRILKGLGPGELRGKGQALCGQFNSLMAKYPFNLKSTNPATLDDVNRFFRPNDGALAQFYSQNLQALVQKQGAQYASKPGGTMNVTPGFLRFFNRAAAFTDAVYPGGSAQPKLTYSLKSDLSGSNQSIALTIDGTAFSPSHGKVQAQQFVWPGASSGVTMQVKFGGDSFNWPRYDGLWAAFEFFADSEERSQPSGSVYQLEWTLRTGQSARAVTTAAGQPVSVRFDLDMMGSPPIFRKGYFSGWSCTADVAR